jgi:hypothetical protein
MLQLHINHINEAEILSSLYSDTAVPVATLLRAVVPRAHTRLVVASASSSSDRAINIGEIRLRFCGSAKVEVPVLNRPNEIRLLMRGGR